ncbi:MAG: hypothetical protein KDH97_10300 [Calditrichaeota bacterium]|nr:hypothetical protein [Calditrichota bacterium]MCB0303905.1 hypothetical protein [Calditrichota bacterium]MCB9086916.1 hypothetical protein [Calditrichia bacterium]
MKNAYKRLDIYKCVHESHKGFGSRMSVHHIRNRKGCYPHGCFHFKWHCKLMKQGKSCYRGFKHMGKDCFGCRYFYEEKVHNYPELQISEKEHDDFLRELNLFEDWLDEHLHREWEIHGRVDGVKPLFRKRVYAKGEGFAFGGFLLIFRELYIGKILMEDHVYVQMSEKTYAALKFGRGDLITARATLSMDRGRLVFKRLRRVEMEERGEAPTWDVSKALVARETATRIPIQPDGCVQCPFGALVDVEDLQEAETRKYRQLYCLKGREDFRTCEDYPRHAGRQEIDNTRPFNSAACMSRKVNVVLKMG